MRIQILAMTVCWAIFAISQTFGQTSKPTVSVTSKPAATSKPSEKSKLTANSTTKIVAKFIPDPSRKEASALFESAKNNQVGKLPRGQVTSFQGDFVFGAHVPEDGDQPARDVEGDYQQLWAFIQEDGKRKFAYRRSVTADLSDWNVTLVCGFDDEIFGFDGKRPIKVQGKKNNLNKKRIREEKRSAKRLFSLLFLNELRPVPETFRIVARNQACPIRIGKASIRARMGSKSATVIGFKTENDQLIKLWIDAAGDATPEVMKAEVVDTKTLFHEKVGGKDVIAPEVFELGYYVEVKLPTGEVIRFPTRVRYKIGSRELMVITVNDKKLIRINSISGKRALAKTFRFDD